MKRLTLAEAEAIARARIASIKAEQLAEKSRRAQAHAASTRDRLRLAAIKRDPLAQAAARARRREPFADDIARFEATTRADLVVGIHEPEPDFDWRPA